MPTNHWIRKRKTLTHSQCIHISWLWTQKKAGSWTIKSQPANAFGKNHTSLASVKKNAKWLFSFELGENSVCNFSCVYLKPFHQSNEEPTNTLHKLAQHKIAHSKRREEKLHIPNGIEWVQKRKQRKKTVSK